ncbi:PA14 domain-containing protein [Rhodovibrionaceae bacterium A322]
MTVKTIRNTLAAALTAASLSLTASVAWANVALPANTAVKNDGMTPGLGVEYYFEYYRHIDELIDWMSYLSPKPGEPLPSLNYDVGQGNVLTSNQDNGVGAHIRGYLHFEQPGTYTFMVNSNDGVRLWLGGQFIMEDPGVHKARFSEPLEVTVDEAGWYPLEMLYYERKNTSTIELHWSKPGDGDGFTIVPEANYAHTPGKPPVPGMVN